MSPPGQVAVMRIVTISAPVSVVMSVGVNIGVRSAFGDDDRHRSPYSLRIDAHAVGDIQRRTVGSNMPMDVFDA